MNKRSDLFMPSPPTAAMTRRSSFPNLSHSACKSAGILWHHYQIRSDTNTAHRIVRHVFESGHAVDNLNYVDGAESVISNQASGGVIDGESVLANAIVYTLGQHAAQQSLTGDSEVRK